MHIRARLKQPQVVEFYEWVLTDEAIDRIRINGQKWERSRFEKALTAWRDSSPEVFCLTGIEFLNQADAVAFRLRFDADIRECAPVLLSDE